MYTNNTTINIDWQHQQEPLFKISFIQKIWHSLLFSLIYIHILLYNYYIHVLIDMDLNCTSV